LLSAKQIPAGKSGQIQVRIKTSGLLDSLEKHVHVRTNDPRNSEITLTIKVVVEPEVEISESSIHFGDAPKGKEVRKEIFLTVRPQRSIEILGAESKDSTVEVKLEPVPGNIGKKWKLTAIQKADAKPGFHYGKILVKTNGRLTQLYTIYVRGTVAAPGK